MGPENKGINIFRGGMSHATDGSSFEDFIRNGNKFVAPKPAPQPVDSLSSRREEKFLEKIRENSKVIAFISDTGRVVAYVLVLPTQFVLVVLPKWVFMSVVPEMAAMVQKLMGPISEMMLNLTKKLLSQQLYRGIMSNYLRTMHSIITSIFSKAGEVAKSTAAKMIEPVNKLVAAVAALTNEAYSKIAKLANRVIESLKETVKEMQTVVQTAVKAVVKAVEPVVSWIATPIKEMAETVQNRAVQFAAYAQQAAGWMQAKVREAVKAVANVAENGAEAAKRFGTKIAKPFSLLAKMEPMDLLKMSYKPVEFMTKVVFPKVVNAAEAVAAQAQKMVEFIKQQPAVMLNLAQQQYKLAVRVVQGISTLAWVKGKIATMRKFVKTTVSIGKGIGRAFKRVKEETKIAVKQALKKGRDLFSRAKKRFRKIAEKVKKVPGLVMERVLFVRGLLFSFLKLIGEFFVKVGQLAALSFRLGGYLFRELYREVRKWG